MFNIFKFIQTFYLNCWRPFKYFKYYVLITLQQIKICNPLSDGGWWRAWLGDRGTSGLVREQRSADYAADNGLQACVLISQEIYPFWTSSFCSTLWCFGRYLALQWTDVLRINSLVPWWNCRPAFAKGWTWHSNKWHGSFP